MNGSANQQPMEWEDGDLGLQCEPFADRPDTRFFYAEPAFMQRLDLLVHLAQFSDSLLVVLGAEGSGKTTLLEQFTAHAADNWRLCILDGLAIRDRAGLLLALQQAFGLDTQVQGEAAVTQLMAHCAALREVTELPLLAVDNAHRLSAELLRGLAVLGGEPQRTVQQLRILLLGEPSLEQTLAAAGLAPGLVPYVQTLQMPRFNEVQTAAYLMYRLTVAGYSGVSPFTSTDVRAMAKHSDGLPGPINVLARDALRERTGREKIMAAHVADDTGKGIRRLLVAGLLGLLVLVALFWLREPEVEVPEVAALPEGQVQRPLSLPGQVAKEKEPEPAVEPTPQEPQKTRQDPHLPRGGQPLAEKAPEPESTAPLQVPVATKPIAESPSAGKPPMESQAESPAEPAATETAEASVPQATSTPAAGGVSAGVTAQTPVPEPTPAPAVTPAVETQAPVTQTKPATATPAAAQPTAGPWLREDWIRRQPAGHYTLQLLGSRNEDSLLKFIRTHGLKGEVAYFKRIHKGGDWYTLLYGSFADRAAATAALAQLPAKVQAAKPWPRTLGSVQAQMPAP